MISPGNYNITAYQGATFDLSATWSIGGTPVDLTSYTAAMQVRESFDSNSTIFSISTGSGITLGGTAGTIDLLVSADTMGSADPGAYTYDLELNSGSSIIRLLRGSFIIEGEVTR